MHTRVVMRSYRAGLLSRFVFVSFRFVVQDTGRGNAWSKGGRDVAFAICIGCGGRSLAGE